jgi:tripartite-type tricarboxylate transporter receptor subunit TctC
MTRPILSTRRQVLAALGAACVAAPLRALAQADKPLQIIVGYPPGGGTDTLARILSMPLQKVTGRTVVVRNVPGAGGQIAASALLREGADGSSILAINEPDLSMAIARNPSAFKSGDFQVMAVDVLEPRVLLVRNDSGIDSLAKFVSEAKAHPGKLSISVTGGTAQELFAKWLVARLGVDVTLVGYKGGAEASTALLGGQVTANLGDDFSRASLRPKTTALFIAGTAPSPRWPEAPTLTSALQPFGIRPPSPTFLARYGVYVVPGAFKTKDPAAYARLQQALLDARTSPEFREYVAKNSLQDLSVGKRGEELEATFAADMEEIRRMN